MRNPQLGMWLAMTLSLLASTGHAANPASGEINAESPSVTFSGGPFIVPNVSPQAAGLVIDEPVCQSDGHSCDVFEFNVNLPADYSDSNPDDLVEITVGWPDPNADYDIYLYDSEGTRLSDAASSADPEIVRFLAQNGNNNYRLVIIPFLPLAQSYSGEAKLVQFGNGSDGPDGGQTPSPVPVEALINPGQISLSGPQMDIYRPDPALGDIRAAEPTLDVDMSSDNVFMLYTTITTKTQFDDSSSPAQAIWSDVSDPYSAVTDTFDPIFVGDHAYDAQGYPDPLAATRLFVVQLQLASSNIAYSDDQGESWLPSVGGGQPHGVDNQSMAAGPFSPEGVLPLAPLYRHATYYCSHSIVNAFCSRSDDGGMSFNPSVPIFQAQDHFGSLACNNHGHVKVSPDGTVYVPQETCENTTGLAVSEDNGLSWEYRTIPFAGTGVSDSSVGTARDGTIYHAYVNSDGKPWVAVSKDHGRTWQHNQPIDGPLGINNTVFPTAIAGDGDRAAVSFHGTSQRGDPDAGAFPGAWYTYVAFTYDGGLNWEIQNVTPGDPVQRGGICNGGISCPSEPPNRNLLDFYDMVIDSQGRVIIGYADGCVDGCVPEGGKPTYSRKGVIARQAGGKTLFAKFDPVMPSAPKAALIKGTRTPLGVRLQWQAPYNGGSPITHYEILRGESELMLRPYAETAGKAGYVDMDANNAQRDYVYRVLARNNYGTSIASNVLNLSADNIDQKSCAQRGLRMLVDDSEANVQREYADAADCGPRDHPLAILHASPDQGTAPQRVRLDASRSQAAGSALTRYVFDFGDGSPEVVSSTAFVEHSYDRAGYFHAKVRVTDANGLVSHNTGETLVVLSENNPQRAGGLLGETRGGALGGFVLILLIAGFRRRR